MFNIGLPELLIIVAIALIVFGPNSGRLKTKLSTLILTV
jgi:Sec-independent protein translocase protein TatA